MDLSALGVAIAPLDAPLDPDPEEARRLLLEELAKSRYQQGGEPDGPPAWLQDILDRINEFLNSLGGEGTVPFWLLALIVVAIAVIVVAFLVFGVPRLRARSAIAADAMFETDDRRDAAAMRRAADAAARAGRWDLAIAERFRAIARSLHERTLVSTLPGSTSHDVARRAAVALPDHADRLAEAANDFDAVRYLGDAGDRERYDRVVELDIEIERARPRIAELASAPGAGA